MIYSSLLPTIPHFGNKLADRILPDIHKSASGIGRQGGFHQRPVFRRQMPQPPLPAFLLGEQLAILQAGQGTAKIQDIIDWLIFHILGRTCQVSLYAVQQP